MAHKTKEFTYHDDIGNEYIERTDEHRNKHVLVNGVEYLFIGHCDDFWGSEIKIIVDLLYPYLHMDYYDSDNVSISNNDYHFDHIITNMEDAKKYINFVNIYNFKSYREDHKTGKIIEQVIGYNEMRKILAEFVLDFNKSCDEIFINIDEELKQKYPGYCFKRFAPSNDIKIALKD
jgi:hypothetical protein